MYLVASFRWICLTHTHLVNREGNIRGPSVLQGPAAKSYFVLEGSALGLSVPPIDLIVEDPLARPVFMLYIRKCGDNTGVYPSPLSPPSPSALAPVTPVAPWHLSYPRLLRVREQHARCTAGPTYRLACGAHVIRTRVMPNIHRDFVFTSVFTTGVIAAPRSSRRFLVTAAAGLSPPVLVVPPQ